MSEEEEHPPTAAVAHRIRVWAGSASVRRSRGLHLHLSAAGGRTSEAICDEVRQLAISLQGEMEEEIPEWKEESGPVNMEMVEGLMKCFDSAGLFCLSLWNKQPTVSY